MSRELGHESNQYNDQRLIAMLERLDKIGMTLNEKKCQFNVDSMEFFGVNFSAKGMLLKTR